MMTVIAPTLERAREVAIEQGLQTGEPVNVISALSPRSLEGMLFREDDRVIVVGIAKGASGKSFPIVDVLRRSLAKSRHVVEPEYVP